MLAELPLATCPSCDGTGQAEALHIERHRYGDAHQTCLACKGLGKVDARRVCPGCGRWLSACTCHAGIYLSLRAERQRPADCTSVLKGVTFNRHTRRWTVTRYANRRTFYFGSFECKERAEALSRELENAPPEQWDAVRDRFGVRRRHRGKVD